MKAKPNLIFKKKLSLHTQVRYKLNKFLFTYSDEEIKQIVRRCYGRMKAYIMKMASLSSDDADDILQETLLKLLEKQPSVLKSKIDGYLFRMVRNACVNFRTRGGHNKTVSLDKMETDAALNLLSELDFENAELKEASRETDLNVILDFADQLPLRTKEIFRMSRLEGKKHAEIAMELGISVRAVEKHLQKSVTKYREEFKNFS